MRSTPVIVFINKLDRPSKEPFDLLDEVEKELRIRVRPLAFPISNGPTFRGVYNLYEKNLSLFTSDEKLTADAQTAEISDLASPELDSYIGAKFAEQLRSDVELVEGVYDEFDREAYLRGELAPVFWGVLAVCGLAVPLVLERFLTHGNSRTQLLWIAALLLVGGFALRWCIVGAGAYDVTQMPEALYGLSTFGLTG